MRPLNDYALHIFEVALTFAKPTFNETVSKILCVVPSHKWNFVFMGY